MRDTRGKQLVLVLTVLLGVLIALQYFFLHTLSYTFTFILVYAIAIASVGIYYHRPHMARHKFVVYGIIISICLSLLLASGLLPLAIKSDYLEIKDIRTEKYGTYSVKVYVDVWVASGTELKYRFLSTGVSHQVVHAQIQVKISDTSGMKAIVVDMTTITSPALSIEGKTTTYYFGTWEVDQAGGSFNIYAKIIAGDTAKQADANRYSVQRGYTLAPYQQGGQPDLGDNGDTGEGFRITQTTCEWYVLDSRIAFNFKVTVRNDLNEDVKTVTVEIALPDGFEIKEATWLDVSGGTDLTIDKVVSGQYRAVTFKQIRPPQEMKEGDTFEITIYAQGTTVTSKDNVDNEVTREFTIAYEPPEETYTASQDKYTEVFAQMFQHILDDSLTTVTVACILLGAIAIIMGKSSGDYSAYMWGSLVASIPVLFTVFSLYLGWVPPSTYFVDLCGGSIITAQFTQAIATLIVLFMFLMIPYMLADVIGSPHE